MPGTVARKIKQTRPFTSDEQEVLLGLRAANARLLEPWEKFLKATAQLTVNQYNVLRILRGSDPTRLPSGEIGDRMVARDPDITRLVDRLARRGLVTRIRSRRDRRVVEVGITEKGRDLLKSLDSHATKYPRVMLGHLGPTRLKQLGTLVERLLSGPTVFP